MTQGELYDYVIGEIEKGISEDDWRPASDMYIEDIAKIAEHEGEKYVTIPNGIRLWLTNGDSLIYVKKEEKKIDPDIVRQGIECCLNREICSCKKCPYEEACWKGVYVTPKNPLKRDILELIKMKEVADK